MNLINSILATFQFELQRMLTVQRVSLAVVMALFPPAMIYVLVQTGAEIVPEFVISVFCGMICLLSLLLWATPNVYAELEGKNWTFIVSSPHGRWSIVFGKYLVALVWSFVVSWIGLCLSMLVVEPGSFGFGALQEESRARRQADRTVIVEGPEESVLAVEQNRPRMADDAPERDEPQFVDQIWMPLRVWLVFSILLFLGSMVYAAIFSFVGVLIQRRAMVFAVGYFLLIEVFLSVIPANIGKIAMTYHLFCIGTEWLPWFLPVGFPERDEFATAYGEFPMWLHLAAILSVTILSLIGAAFVIKKREYITLEDANV